MKNLLISFFQTKQRLDSITALVALLEREGSSQHALDNRVAVHITWIGNHNYSRRNADVVVDGELIKRLKVSLLWPRFALSDQRLSRRSSQ